MSFPCDAAEKHTQFGNSRNESAEFSHNYLLLVASLQTVLKPAPPEPNKHNTTRTGNGRDKNAKFSHDPSPVQSKPAALKKPARLKPGPNKSTHTRQVGNSRNENAEFSHDEWSNFPLEKTTKYLVL